MKIPAFPDVPTYTGDDGREYDVPTEETSTGLVAVPTINESHQAGADTPDRGAFKTVTFAGAATDQPQLLLPYDANRFEAFIVVQVATGGVVYVGKQNQVDTQSSKPGAALPAGTYPYRAKEAVYVLSDLAHAATVSFIASGWNN
jgi:hypothetical protein